MSPGILLYLYLASSTSCQDTYSDEKISDLLNSKDPENLITGAFEAGESGKTAFIPLLLLNADNSSCCANIRFKNFTVYQEKMIALRKIMKVKPFRKLTRQPDSLIIRFYSILANKKYHQQSVVDSVKQLLYNETYDKGAKPIQNPKFLN